MTNSRLFARRIKSHKQDEHRVKSFISYFVKVNILNERVVSRCVIVNQTIRRAISTSKRKTYVTLYKFHSLMAARIMLLN